MSEVRTVSDGSLDALRCGGPKRDPHHAGFKCEGCDQQRSVSFPTYCPARVAALVEERDAAESALQKMIEKHREDRRALGIAEKGLTFYRDFDPGWPEYVHHDMGRRARADLAEIAGAKGEG